MAAPNVALNALHRHCGWRAPGCVLPLCQGRVLYVAILRRVAAIKTAERTAAARRLTTKLPLLLPGPDGLRGPGHLPGHSLSSSSVVARPRAVSLADQLQLKLRHLLLQAEKRCCIRAAADLCLLCCC